MTDQQTRYLAGRIADLERRLRAQERAARLTKSTVGIATSADDDAPVIDLDVSGALFTGVEASADAMNAQASADAAAAAAAFNLGGARYATPAARDTAIPSPQEGMQVYVVSTGLDYQYSAGAWVPLLQYVDKGQTNDVLNNTDVLTADEELRLTLVPGVYRVEAFLHVMGDPGADVKIAWTYSGFFNPGGAVRACIGPAVSEGTILDTTVKSSGHAFSTVVPYGTTSEASFGTIREDMVLRTATTGVLQLWWAQNVAMPSDLTMQYVSRLYVTKVA